MSEDRKGFVISCDIIDIVDLFSDENAGRLFTYVLQYMNGNHPDIKDQALLVAFEIIKRDLIRNNLFLQQTFVYCIRLTDPHEDFIKVGIANNVVKRFGDFRSIGYDVTSIFIEPFSNREMAFARESKLHQQLLIKKYFPTKKFGGYTECFTLDSLKLINQNG